LNPIADGHEDLALKSDRQTIAAALSTEVTCGSVGVALGGNTSDLEFDPDKPTEQPGSPARDGHIRRIEGKSGDGTMFEGYDCVVFMTKGHAVALPLNESSREPELTANRPNPFNPVTRISFYLPEEAYVRLEIFNILGQREATPIDRVVEDEEHSVEWDAKNAASGVYFYRFQAGEYVQTKKMLFLK
jgi:hypothetical protein